MYVDDGARAGARTGPAPLDISALYEPDRLIAALLDAGSWGASEEDAWLHARYAELVPAIIPDVLLCLRTGESLPAAVLDPIAASARASHGSSVPYATVLRGGIPAVTCFARFVHDSDPRPSVRETSIVLGRAAVLAQEMGAHWAESWRGVVPPPEPGGRPAVTSEAVEARAGSLDSPALEMVAMVAEGRSNEQIAAATSYSTQAVKWHLARVMRAWGARNRASLVAGAFARGVLRRRH